mgnify:CR=1 FL=1
MNFLIIGGVPSFRAVSESSFGGSSEGCLERQILRWEAEGWLGPEMPVRLMGLARTYFASLCAILALAAEVLFLASTIVCDFK